VSLLPPNFEIQRLPANNWVQVDRLLLASYAAARANGHIPAEYFEFMRQTVFARFGLPPKNEPRERIYVSRALTHHCRILNEEQLIELLSRYGFKSVVLEKLDFREQVELFHRAEVIVAPFGSNWGNLVWAGKIKIFILYPNRPPSTHFFTYAKALGQEHFFLAERESSAWSDFKVDLDEVENVLKNEMGLRQVASV
jgi:capsular polysaccharide biosynthesis protein